MEHQFWHEKWETDDLGFHLENYNPVLLRHWHSLDIPAGGPVLVPLCGKSVDMLWLAGQGHDVLGVELSEIAARSFFEENGLDAVREDIGPYTSYKSERVEILCGDFFSLDPARLRDVVAIYERASLIALPATQRAKYVDKMKSLLQTGVRSLLITLYSSWCEVEFLEEAETEVKGHLCPQSAYRLLVK